MCAQCGIREVQQIDNGIIHLQRNVLNCVSSCEACNPFPEQRNKLHEMVALYEDVRDTLTRENEPVGNTWYITIHARVFGHPDFVQGIIDRGICCPQKFWDYIERSYDYQEYNTDALQLKSIRLFLAAGCIPPARTMRKMAAAQLIDCVSILHDWGMVFDKTCWQAANQHVECRYNYQENSLSPPDREYLRELLRRTGFRATIANTLDMPHRFINLYLFPIGLSVVRDVLDAPFEEMDEAWRVLFANLPYITGWSEEIRTVNRRCVAKMVEMGYPLPPVDAETRIKLFHIIQRTSSVDAEESAEAVTEKEVLGKIHAYLGGCD